MHMPRRCHARACPSSSSSSSQAADGAAELLTAVGWAELLDSQLDLQWAVHLDSQLDRADLLWARLQWADLQVELQTVYRTADEEHLVLLNCIRAD